MLSWCQLCLFSNRSPNLFPIRKYPFEPSGYYQSKSQSIVAALLQLKAANISEFVHIATHLLDTWTPRVRTCWLRFVYISNFPNRAKHYARTTAAVAEPKQNVQQPQSAWWESKKEFECFQDAIVLRGSVLQYQEQESIARGHSPQISNRRKMKV